MDEWLAGFLAISCRFVQTQRGREPKEHAASPSGAAPADEASGELSKAC
jgi:hypothetical protein